MKKLAILSPLVLLATAALAQDSTCILQPSCSQLGYTSAEADCGTQKVLRCPFDVSQVACVGGSGSGGSDGDGGSVETDEFGTVDNSSCQVGYYYYSDDTCSPEYNYFKDVIGIVFDVNRRYIVSLNQKEGTSWTTKTSTQANIPYITSNTEILRDLNGCSHTKAIKDLNDLSSYPAAQFCIEDNTGNKEWFLPSTGQLYILFNKLNSVTNPLIKTGGKAITTSVQSYNAYYVASSLKKESIIYSYHVSSANFEPQTINSTFKGLVTRCIAEY